MVMVSNKGICIGHAGAGPGIAPATVEVTMSLDGRTIWARRHENGSSGQKVFRPVPGS